MRDAALKARGNEKVVVTPSDPNTQQSAIIQTKATGFSQEPASHRADGTRGRRRMSVTWMSILLLLLGGVLLRAVEHTRSGDDAYRVFDGVGSVDNAVFHEDRRAKKHPPENGKREQYAITRASTKVDSRCT